MSGATQNAFAPAAHVQDNATSLVIHSRTTPYGTYSNVTLIPLQDSSVPARLFFVYSGSELLSALQRSFLANGDIQIILRANVTINKCVTGVLLD